MRLRQGRAEEKTVYSDDPVSVARAWASRGGDWLHVVDLDAAFSGVQSNLALVRRMADAAGIPVQLGGGIRDEAAVERALEAGVSRVVIGTRAAEGDDFLARMVGRFGRDRIAVGIDARDGFVAVRGWTSSTKLAALDLARVAESSGVAAIIYTDIATDGMLQGPNMQAIEAMVAATTVPVISSGGVSSAGDLRALAKVRGLAGAIVGKALFDGLIPGNLRAVLDQPED